MRTRERLLAILTAMFALAACAAGTEIETVGGGTSRISDPVTVDILDARFNIPVLLPEVDAVRRALRDNGSVVQEIYFAGEARVAIVEHVGDAWFNQISISRAEDPSSFAAFLERTPMRGAAPQISPVADTGTVGFVAFDGRCLAFRFLKRVKGNTGYSNDEDDPDTFVAGYSCAIETGRLVEAFGFMSPEDAAHLERRTSI